MNLEYKIVSNKMKIIEEREFDKFLSAVQQRNFPLAKGIFVNLIHLPNFITNFSETINNEFIKAFNEFFIVVPVESISLIIDTCFILTKNHYISKAFQQTSLIPCLFEFISQKRDDEIVLKVLSIISNLCNCIDSYKANDIIVYSFLLSDIFNAISNIQIKNLILQIFYRLSIAISNEDQYNSNNNSNNNYNEKFDNNLIFTILENLFKMNELELYPNSMVLFSFFVHKYKKQYPNILQLILESSYLEKCKNHVYFDDIPEDVIKKYLSLISPYSSSQEINTFTNDPDFFFSCLEKLSAPYPSSLIVLLINQFCHLEGEGRMTFIFKIFEENEGIIFEKLKKTLYEGKNKEKINIIILFTNLIRVSDTFPSFFTDVEYFALLVDFLDLDDKKLLLEILDSLFVLLIKLRSDSDVATIVENWESQISMEELLCKLNELVQDENEKAELVIQKLNNILNFNII